MSTLHQAFVFDEAGFRRELAPLLDRQDSAALEHFIDDHRSRLRDPKSDAPLETGWRETHAITGFPALAALALTAYYDPAANIGLGGAAEKLRFALMDLYPEGRVFVGGGALAVVGGTFQSADYVAKSVEILQTLRAENRLKTDVIDPVLSMLQKAATAGKGLYLTL